MRAQVPIFELLHKFDGARMHDDIKTGRRRYRLTRLPAFLVLHMKRFTKNNFFWEKNPTIVNFPVRNLELRDVVPVPRGARATDSPLYVRSELGCVLGMMGHMVAWCNASGFQVGTGWLQEQ